MNNSLTINTKKATTLCRSFFILLLFVASSLLSLGQEVEVVHYQKKCELETLILPNQKYNSSLFTIPFPDSMYTGGTIKLKKLLVSGIKLKATFTFSHDTYTKAEFIVSKKQKEKLLELISQDNGEINITITKFRRKYLVVVKLN